MALNDRIEATHMAIGSRSENQLQVLERTLSREEGLGLASWFVCGLLGLTAGTVTWHELGVMLSERGSQRTVLVTDQSSTSVPRSVHAHLGVKRILLSGLAEFGCSDDQFDISVDELLELAVFIRFRIDTLLTLPADLRERRISTLISRYQITKEALITLDAWQSSILDR